MEKIEYFCGYEVHTDIKPYVKLFASSTTSKTIDIYDKYILKKLLKDFELSDVFVPLAAVSFLLDIASRQAINMSLKDTEVESISIVSFLDKFNKYNIRIFSASEVSTKLTAMISDDPKMLNNVYLYTLQYRTDKIKDIEVPKNIEFSERHTDRHLAFTLNDYYMNNESIICTFS